MSEKYRWRDRCAPDESPPRSQIEQANADWAARPEPEYTLKDPAEKFLNLRKMLGLGPSGVEHD